MISAEPPMATTTLVIVVARSALGSKHRSTAGDSREIGLYAGGRRQRVQIGVQIEKRDVIDADSNQVVLDFGAGSEPDRDVRLTRATHERVTVHASGGDAE